MSWLNDEAPSNMLDCSWKKKIGQSYNMSEMIWFIHGYLCIHNNTHKVCTTGDIPITNILVKCRRSFKHAILYTKITQQDDCRKKDYHSIMKRNHWQILWFEQMIVYNTDFVTYKISDVWYIPASNIWITLVSSAKQILHTIYLWYIPVFNVTVYMFRYSSGQRNNWNPMSIQRELFCQEPCLKWFC